LNAHFFPLIIAANVVLLWAYHQTVRAGIWPTERFFWWRRRKPFQTLNVIRQLRQLAKNSADPRQARQYRRWLIAIYLGWSLGLLALLIFAAFVPWLIAQIP